MDSCATALRRPMTECSPCKSSA